MDGSDSRFQFGELVNSEESTGCDKLWVLLSRYFDCLLTLRILQNSHCVSGVAAPGVEYRASATLAADTTPPLDRSIWADKHTLALSDRDARRWFIEPWYGVSAEMGFEALCRWLATAFGSDAFADRYWLSLHRQLRDADGCPPDFLGSYGRLGLPARALPLLNARPEGLPEASAGADTVAVLRRRYAEDFLFGGYDDAGAGPDA